MMRHVDGPRVVPEKRVSSSRDPANRPRSMMLSISVPEIELCSRSASLARSPDIRGVSSVPVALAVGGAWAASVWNTFVGQGEPLLCASLGRLLREVRKMTEIPIAVITNSFTAGGGDGYDAFGAAENVSLRADDDSQIRYERAFREFPAALPAGVAGSGAASCWTVTLAPRPTR